MTEAVLDASVLLDWYAQEYTPPPGSRLLRRRFDAGALGAVAPPVVRLEMLNIAGRRWRWPAAELAAFASAILQLPLELVEPDLRSVAAWVDRGLSPYDASYVALAEGRGIPLFTRDREILAAAPDIARLPEEESGR